MQDDIGIKINSILLTDDCLDFDITFKFNEEINVDSKNFSFGYAVYDENKNIYNIQPRLFSKNKENNKISFIYKELGLNYDTKSATAQQFSDIATQQITGVSEANRTIDFNLTFRAKDKFPQSKTIYIKIFDLGYTMSDIENENNELTIKNSEDFNLSKAKWNLEIEVPKKFYERNTTELTTKNNIPGIDIENILISETGMTIKFKSKEYDKIVKSGIDMEAEGQHSKLINDIPDPDITISMGCNVGCPFIGRPFDDNWGLEDPTGKSDEEFKVVIEQIRHDILGLKGRLNQVAGAE